MKQEDRLRVFQKYDGHCAYCGGLIYVDSFEIDHVVPIKRGGYCPKDLMEHSNLNPACKNCNRDKASMPLESWRLWIVKHLEVLRKKRAFHVCNAFGLIHDYGGPIEMASVEFYFERINK